MEKHFILLALVVGLSLSLIPPVVGLHLPTEIIPLVVQLDYGNGTGAIKDCSMNYSVYYGNGTYFGWYGATEIVDGTYHNYSFSTNKTGDYFALAKCSKTGKYYTTGLPFTVGGDDNMIISVIILAPLILGIMLLMWGHNLSEEHEILSIFISLLSYVMFWVTLYLGNIAVIKFYNFPELQNAMGFVTNITGWILFLIVAYWLIYIFYRIITSIQQRRKRELEY